MDRIFHKDNAPSALSAQPLRTLRLKWRVLVRIKNAETAKGAEKTNS